MNMKAQTGQMTQIKHHATCHADYPEKGEGEIPQATTRIELGDGEAIIQCNDCGAFAPAEDEAPQ